MNDLRTAAQQALEAYDQHEPLAVVMEALRAALAEPRPIHECYGDCPTNPQTCPNPCKFEGRPRPVQEPVAIVEQLWSIIDDIDTYTDMAKADDKLYRSLVERRQADRWKTGITTDGYTLNIPSCSAPTQRKPLTEEEINDLMDQIPREDIDSWSFRQGVYAAEKHHGIRP